MASGLELWSESELEKLPDLEKLRPVRKLGDFTIARRTTQTFR